MDKATETLPEYYDEIKNSQNSSELEKIRHVAHTIKGLSKNLFAPELLETSKKLKEAAEEYKLDKTDNLISEFEKTYQKTLSILEEEKNQIK